MILACILSVTDGDTIRCSAERIRIRGIDAPEIHACPKRRVCTPGDGQASKRALQHILGTGRVEIERLGCDHYGRTVAHLRVNGRDVGTMMVAGGYAVWRYLDLKPGRCG